jgi:hypothetical protein
VSGSVDPTFSFTEGARRRPLLASRKLSIDRPQKRDDTCGNDKAGGNRMAGEEQWRHMASAPKDGSRILVTVRSSEQGPAEVDLAYWAHGDHHGGEGWRASDSAPGCIIEYAEPELKCWMPMPTANVARAAMPAPWEGEDADELDGSGI